MKIGKEVFTKAIHKAVGQLAPAETDRSSTEFVAPEDMYIIGCSFGKAAAISGGQGITSIARGGTYREMGSYTADENFISDDQPMFVWSTMGDIVTAFPTECTRTWYLPEGNYYFLEKGERLYLHHSAKNNGVGNYDFGITALLHYTKTKP